MNKLEQIYIKGYNDYISKIAQSFNNGQTNTPSETALNQIGTQTTNQPPLNVNNGQLNNTKMPTNFTGNVGSIFSNNNQQPNVNQSNQLPSATAFNSKLPAQPKITNYNQK